MANFNNWANGGQIGNFFAGASGFGGTESEEERRRREYEEAYGKVAPVAPGGMGTAVTPAANAMVAAPQAPVAVPPPQAPQAYSGQGLDPRQIQAESGGRNFDAQGNPLTSPKGAMYANQVMPATAQNPGFGVRPAQSQTPEEYNRVGNDYMDMLRKRYPGDEASALAAYNAGPGTVDKNRASNQGQLNIPALPKETQSYIDKILPPAKKIAETVLNAVVPSAQAAPAAISPEQQAIQNKQGLSFNNAVSGPTGGQMAPITAPASQPAPQGEGYYDQRWYDTFTQAQQNPLAMVALANNTTAPAGIRQAAAANQYQALQMARDEQLANKQVQQAINDPSAISRILKEKNDEGSWGKAVLFSLLGSKSLAESEYTKLGKGAVWQNTTDVDGNPVLAQIRADGLPMRGYDIATGAELDSKQLASVAGGIGANRGDYVGGTVTNDSMKLSGRVVSKNGRTMVESNGRYYPYTQEWRNNTVGTDVANKRQMAAVDLQNKLAGMSAQARLNAFADANKAFVNNGWAPLSLGEMGIDSTGNTTTGAGGAPAPAGAGGVPSSAGASQKTRPNATTLKAQEIGRDEIVRESSKIVAKQADFITKIDNYNDVLKHLDKQETNFGGLFNEGIIPGEKTVGKVFGTKDFENTQTTLREIKSIQSQAAKLLGINPTDKDLAFVVENSPDESWTNEAVANYIRKYQKAARRTLEIAQKQVESGGTYEEPMPDEGSTELPKVSDQAAYEKLAPGTEYIAPDGTKRTKK